jgi:hypothetical protein
MTLQILHHLAQQPQTLVPNRAPAQLTVPEGNLEVLLPWLFRTGVVIAGVLAAVYLVIAGFQYMTTDAVSKKSGAKGRIQEIFIGLAIALFSFIILQTINPAILVFDLARLGGRPIGAVDPNLRNLGVIFTSGNTQIATTPLQPGGSGVIDTANGTSGTLTEQQALSVWNQNGITLNNTSAEGVREVTVLGAMQIKNAAGVDRMVITSVTSGQHASGTYSHANGYKIDIGKNSNGEANYNKLVTYFEGVVGKKIQYNDFSTQYVAETPDYVMRVIRHDPDHLDVQFKPKN